MVARDPTKQEVGMSAATPSLRLILSEVRLTWAEAWEEFREERLLEGLAPGYVDQFLHALRPLVRWMPDTLGHDCLADLTEADARAFLRHAKEQGVSDRGPVGMCRWNHLLTLNRRLFAWMLERGYSDTNPFAGIKKTREHRRIIRTFSEEQLAALFAQPNTRTFVGLRDRVLLSVFLGTGLRLTGALGLRVDDIDLHEGRAKIINKGGDEQFVGLPRCLRGELRQYLPEREVELECNGLAASAWLFPNQDGNRLGTRTVQDNLRRYGEQAGIEDVRVSPHTFRHTYAAALWRQCHDLETVRRALRHSDIRTTQRYLESLGVDDVIDWVRDLSPLQTMDLPPLRGRRIRRRGPGGGAASPDRG